MAAYGQHKPYRSVRLSAYNCLSSWLTVASCSSGVEKHPELVNYIISDVQFKKPTVTLNMSSKMLKGKMGKKQRQALVNQTISKKEEHVADSEANSDVCLAALNTIPPLLESVSSLLPAKSHKDLQTAVCSELLITQLNSGDRIPLPYSVKHCRLGLYKSFVAMCHNFHPSFPPPLSFASQLISGGLVDSFDEIVRFCTVSLSSVDKMLRPIGPTLSFPIEFPEMTFFPKKISLDVSQCSTPSLTSTPRNESGKTQDNDGSVIIKGRISSNLNGGDASNVPELDLNPILVDPEMSDFDYMSPTKNQDKSTVVDTNKSPSPPSNEARDQARSDGSQTVSEPAASDSSKENGDSSRTVKLQNGDSSPKRKSEMTSESQPSAKKVKTDLEEGVTIIESDEDIYAAATQNPFADGSEVTSGKDAVAESTEKTLWPDDDMEEAMMNSFVDEVL
uniref:Proline-, glutamic acid-and leucine-rich protein 1 n=1 Tax=Lygus hesperus TaxID=30085 RepID=A0A0A9YV87_LYGHE